MRMRLHSRCLANPQQLHATRSQPRSFILVRREYPQARKVHFPTTSSSGSCASSRNSRPDALVMPSLPHGTRQPVDGSLACWLVLPEVRPRRHQTAPPLLPPHPPIPSLAPSMSPLLRTVRRRSLSPSSRSLLRETLSTPLLSASTSRPPCHP